MDSAAHRQLPRARAGDAAGLDGAADENYRRTADLRREFFKGPHPTATRVIVHGLLRPGAVIEISAVAVLPG